MSTLKEKQFKELVEKLQKTAYDMGVKYGVNSTAGAVLDIVNDETVSNDGKKEKIKMFCENLLNCKH